MNALITTRPTIDTMDESVSVSMAGSSSETDLASRPLLHRALEITKSAGGLGDAFQRDDRKTLPAATMLDAVVAKLGPTGQLVILTVYVE
jgi:hypothetical protein